MCPWSLTATSPAGVACWMRVYGTAGDLAWGQGNLSIPDEAAWWKATRAVLRGDRAAAVTGLKRAGFVVEETT
jgi:hypothetical protein